MRVRCPRRASAGAAEPPPPDDPNPIRSTNVEGTLRTPALRLTTSTGFIGLAVILYQPGSPGLPRSGPAQVKLLATADGRVAGRSGTHVRPRLGQRFDDRTLARKAGLPDLEMVRAG